MLKTKSGFTIVELLIVIVVIGILAAITIVAYNGIQTRAKNSSTVSVVSSYLKGLSQFAIVNNRYPVIDNLGSTYACLGENNPSSRCWVRNTETIQQTNFNNELRPFMGGKLPDVDPTIADSQNGVMFVNHTSSAVTLDGSQYPYYIFYMLLGSGQKCPVGQVLSGGWATFTSTVPSSGYTNTGSNSTNCWIKLPNPATQ